MVSSLIQCQFEACVQFTSEAPVGLGLQQLGMGQQRLGMLQNPEEMVVEQHKPGVRLGLGLI